MNTVRVMAVAQGLGCALVVAAGILLGSGYLAGAVAMVATILLLIALNVIHPPAISTALDLPLSCREIGHRYCSRLRSCCWDPGHDAADRAVDAASLRGGNVIPDGASLGGLSVVVWPLVSGTVV